MINLSINDILAIDASIFDDSIDRGQLASNITYTKDILNEVSNNLSVGTHMLSLALPEQELRLVIFKDSENHVMLSPNVLHFAAHCSAALVSESATFLGLHSFMGNSNDSIETLVHRTPQELKETYQEIRGWMSSDDIFISLDSDQLIDIHCLDFATGNVISPPVNTRFCDSWALTRQ